MNVVQIVCLVVASGLLIWSLVSFVLACVKRAKLRKLQDRDNDGKEV